MSLPPLNRVSTRIRPCMWCVRQQRAVCLCEEIWLVLGLNKDKTMTKHRLGHKGTAYLSTGGYKLNIHKLER